MKYKNVRYTIPAWEILKKTKEKYKKKTKTSYSFSDLALDTYGK